MTHFILAICVAVAVGYVVGLLHAEAICAKQARRAAGTALTSNTYVYRACTETPGGEVCRRTFAHGDN